LTINCFIGTSIAVLFCFDSPNISSLWNSKNPGYSFGSIESFTIKRFALISFEFIWIIALYIFEMEMSRIYLASTFLHRANDCKKRQGKSLTTILSFPFGRKMVAFRISLGSTLKTEDDLRDILYAV